MGLAQGRGEGGGRGWSRSLASVAGEGEAVPAEAVERTLVVPAPHGRRKREGWSRRQ